MKKKIYYWAPFFSNIATTKAVINSAISLKKFSSGKYEPVIIDVFGEWDDYINILKENKISLEKLNLDKFFKNKKIHGYLRSRFYQLKIFFLAFFPLLKLLREKKPDTLILHLVTSLPLLVNFFFKIETKTVLRISGLPKFNFLRKFFWKIALNKIDIITAPTIATKKNLSDILTKKDIFLLRDPIIFLKNINLKKNFINKNKYYVAIGRLTKQKNFNFLIDCFKSIIQKDGNIKLKILGEGENFDDLSKFIKKNNLQKNIFLEGYKSNVYEYLVNSEAFILSSLWEDPGFVLVEAAYANTSIISSDCNNGPLEILDNGKNGFLFKSNNKEDFLKIFWNFKKTDPKSIYRKKINSKKMSKKYSLFNHYLKLKEII